MNELAITPIDASNSASESESESESEFDPHVEFECAVHPPNNLPNLPNLSTTPDSDSDNDTITVPPDPDWPFLWPNDRTVSRAKVTYRRNRLITRIEAIRDNRTSSGHLDEVISEEERQGWRYWGAQMVMLLQMHQALDDYDAQEELLFELLAHGQIYISKDIVFRRLARLYAIRGEPTKACFFCREAEMAGPKEKRRSWDIPMVYARYRNQMIREWKLKNEDEYRKLVAVVQRIVNGLHRTEWKEIQEEEKEKLRKLLDFLEKHSDSQERSILADLAK